LAWNAEKWELSLFWTALFLALCFNSITEANRMMSLGLPLNASGWFVWVYLFLAFRSILVEKTRDIAVVLPSTDPAYLICPQCKLEQWRGYDQCQKCGKQIINS
jgi:hypothetical protein